MARVYSCGHPTKFSTQGIFGIHRTVRGLLHVWGEYIKILSQKFWGVVAPVAARLCLYLGKTGVEVYNPPGNPCHMP